MINELYKICSTYDNLLTYPFKDFQQEIFQYYINHKDIPNIKNKIFSIIEKYTIIEHYDNWISLFKDEEDMVYQIDLIKTKSIAKHCISPFLPQTSKNLHLPTVIHLTIFSCYKNNIWDSEKEKIWMDTFKNFPEFETLLKKEKTKILKPKKNHFENLILLKKLYNVLINYQFGTL